VGHSPLRSLRFRFLVLRGCIHSGRLTNMKRLLGLLFALTAALATVSSASSFIGSGPTLSLTGSEVTAIGYFPTLQDPFTNTATATVSSLNIEFPEGSIFSTAPSKPILTLSADISTSSITVQYLSSQQAAMGTFNGLVFTFDSSSPVITGVSLDPSSTVKTVALTFGPHDVAYSDPGLLVTPASRFTIDLTLAPVPEPSTLWLIAAAVPLVALAATRRRVRA
jgi:hypothetical protein